MGDQLIQTILVPQGAEYKAVCRGLRSAANPPSVLPIPAGPKALERYLIRLLENPQVLGQTVLLMGLCGSLTPTLTIGSFVLYQNCISAGTNSPVLACNAQLTEIVQKKLAVPISFAQSVTNDRVVCTRVEKHHLAHAYAATVVDMEGYVALERLGAAGIAVAMLRVVSDDCQHDLPDLSQAIDQNGSLRPFPLAVQMVKQPIAALRLIQGSLQGLAQLERLIHQLFCR